MSQASSVSSSGCSGAQSTRDLCGHLGQLVIGLVKGKENLLQISRTGLTAGDI